MYYKDVILSYYSQFLIINKNNVGDRLKTKRLVVVESIPGGIFYKSVEKLIQFNVINVESNNLGKFGGSFSLKVKNDIRKMGPKQINITNNNINSVEQARNFAIMMHSRFR